MRRRRLLASGLALLAGCGDAPLGGSAGGEAVESGGGATDDGSTATGEAATPTAAPSTSETASEGSSGDPGSSHESTGSVVRGRQSAGSDSGGSLFAGVPCPDHLRCFHAAPPDAAVSLEPDREVVDLGRRFAVTVRNRSDAPVEYGPYHWDVKRRRGGEWTSVDDRDAVFGYRRTLPAGESQRIGGPVTRRRNPGEETLAAIGFEPGVYRFELDLFRGDTGRIERWAVLFRVRPGFGRP